MADDGSQQRKPDFRTAVEDVEALAMVLVMKLESVLGRRLVFRNPAVLAAIGVAATLVLAVVVVIALLSAGDAKAVSDNAPLIAAVVALGGVFTAQMVSIALEVQRARETRALEDRRTQEARDLEAQRAGEAALQNYFEAVGELLIEKPLRRASPGDNLSAVVRAQTLSVLEGLDPDRKRILLQFLYESRLIQKDKPVVSLVLADLSNANLYNTILTRANLKGANLSHAVLDLAGLNRAVLSDAYLGNARLRGTHLMGADLSRAILLGADLSRAKMQGATGVTSQQLEQQAYSLEGAIMPDGSKHP